MKNLFEPARVAERALPPDSDRNEIVREILFVQGAGKAVHDEWDNKLVESLRREVGPAYEVRYPVMPNEADPQLAAWRVALESEIAALGRWPGAQGPLFVKPNTLGAKIGIFADSLCRTFAEATERARRIATPMHPRRHW